MIAQRGAAFSMMSHVDFKKLHNLIWLENHSKQNKHCNIVVEPSRRVVINRRLKFRGRKNGKVSWSSLLLRREPARVSIELDSGQLLFFFSKKSKVSLKTCNFAIIDNGSLNAAKVESELIGKKRKAQRQRTTRIHWFSTHVLECSFSTAHFFTATKLTFLCK